MVDIDDDIDLGPPPSLLPGQFTYGEDLNRKKYTVFLPNGDSYFGKFYIFS